MKTLFDMEEPTPAPTWTGPQLAWLTSHPNSGRATALKVAQLIPNPDNFADQWPNLKHTAGHRAANIPATTPADDHPFEGVDCIGYYDADYPEPLRNIPDPPAVLWTRGHLSPQPGIAIVGTRHPNEWGAHVATRAARWATNNKHTVVSGLAFGCDTIAHQEALTNNGTTIAILGGSLLNPKPVANRHLAVQILEEGGALITEVAPDQDITAANLVNRNRIQSGLSQATVIAQTGIPGGTLHTARFTLQQHRHLIVPKPTNPWDTPDTAGNAALTTNKDRNFVVDRVLQARGTTATDLLARDTLVAAAPTTHHELFEALDRLLT